MTTYLLPHANIQWLSEASPFAPDYDDVYWSSAGGLEEKTHVFIEGCELIQRWQQMPANNRFTIAELGFGFGLNFLLTLRAWRQHRAGKDANQYHSLHFVSFEKHLVPFAAIARIAHAFKLEAEAELLRDHYPEPVPGPHVLQLTDDCSLTLVLGDVSEAAKQLRGNIDALFLDGFSPSRNEIMWQPAVVRAFIDQLVPGGRVSTYSVAGSLRRQLADAGLVVEKAPGFGHKRHMLKAKAPGQWAPTQMGGKSIAVIGAGITGLLMARALETRNHHVTLFDQSGQAYGAVKDIHQIAIYPQLSLTPQPYSNLYLRAFLYARRHLPLHPCGRLELLDTEDKLKRGERLAAQLSPILKLKSAAECSELLGLEVSHTGLFNQSAGWLSPQAIDPTRKVIKKKLTQLAPSDDGWQLDFETTSMLFDAVILTTGPAQLEHLAPLNLMPLRGQSLRVSTQAAPKCVLSAAKTWFPINDKGESTVSGTYDRFDADIAVRQEDSETLLAALGPKHTKLSYTAQVGIRTATRDRLPVVDSIPDWHALDMALKANPTLDRGTFNDYLPNLYCAVGFGSHAGTLGPYCSELLAGRIDNELQTENIAQLSSIRFALRDGKL